MLTATEYRTLRTKITRAENAVRRARTAAAAPECANRSPGKDADEAVRLAATRLAEVGRAGLARFEDAGYPDDWSRWQRAAEEGDTLRRYYA